MNEHENLPPLEHVSPLEQFLRQDIAAACCLLLAAVAALAVANTGFNTWYSHFWEKEAGFALGTIVVTKPLHLWVNDGLMSVFFFLVGLEIKRELLVGELAGFRKAILPVAAAVGGMVFPAMIYALFNRGSETVIGWGIPMATDIAFAAGCLALLGKRAPTSLGVFLVALAIVDDIGSVLVIAVFYTERIAPVPLETGACLVALSFILCRLGVRRTWPYVVLGILIWIAFLTSGVHATLAGVLLAFTIPADARYETPHFFTRMRTLLDRFRTAEDYVNPLLVNARQQTLIRFIRKECHHVEAPLQRIEHNLHPFCVFLVMPVFAFANSGIHLDWGNLGSLLAERVTVGVFLGLVIGKQLGITLFSWITVKLGAAELPNDLRWLHIYGIGWLAGIGFTMALFINELAFVTGGTAGDAAAAYHAQATVGTFSASLLCGAVGLLILQATCRRAP